MKQLLVLMMLVCSTVAFAQDVIVKRDGSAILAKVLEVNIDDIKYKKYSNQNGPNYTINKSEIMTINYENGEKVDFAEKRDQEQMSQGISQRMIMKVPDTRNAEIISLYNRIFYPSTKVKRKDSPSKDYAIIIGIKPSSIMSNDDIEITFFRDVYESPYGRKRLVYCINIKNKTNKIIYIDKGNCFRISEDGLSYCYFENNEQTTVNMGGGSGASLGLGSVAGALGIGGVAGHIAGGINIGGGTSHSVSKTYSKQRIIAIPPHGSRNLTDEKWIKTKEARSWLSPEEYEHIETTERFDFNRLNSSTLGLKQGMVNKGEIIIFEEDELPWKREYYITYSTDEDFRTYSFINARLYIHELIGTYIPYFSDDSYACDYNNDYEYNIEGIDNHVILGHHYSNKK